MPMKKGYGMYAMGSYESGAAAYCPGMGKGQPKGTHIKTTKTPTGKYSPPKKVKVASKRKY